MSSKPFSSEGDPLAPALGCALGGVFGALGCLFLAGLVAVLVTAGTLWFFTALVVGFTVVWGGLYLWEKSR